MIASSVLQSTENRKGGHNRDGHGRDVTDKIHVINLCPEINVKLQKGTFEHCFKFLL